MLNTSKSAFFLPIAKPHRNKNSDSIMGENNFLTNQNFGISPFNKTVSGGFGNNGNVSTFYNTSSGNFKSNF